MAKERLDTLLVERGLAPSRQRAKALIMEGKVFVDGQREDKAGTMITPEAAGRIVVKGDPIPFVSRGGLKLAKAVEVFSLKFDGMVCLDIGASTGGFTDCMLQNGAARVYAVDVGYGQLAYSLRTDPRVVCMEKTNFRYLEPAALDEPVDFAGADVSFISLSKIFPAAFSVLREEAGMVALIKPQFEAGKERVGKKGVVRDPAVHIEVIEDVMSAAVTCGFTVCGLDHSPVKGPEGNIEYLLLLQKTVAKQEPEAFPAERITEIVSKAHEALTGEA